MEGQCASHIFSYIFDLLLLVKLVKVYSLFCSYFVNAYSTQDQCY